MAVSPFPLPDRKTVFEVDRRDTDLEQRRQAHIPLLLGDGVAGANIAKVLYTTTVTMHRWRRPSLEEGTNCVVGRYCWPTSMREGWLGRRFDIPDRNGRLRRFTPGRPITVDCV